MKEGKFGLATCYANLNDSVNARKQCYSLLLDDENWMPALNLLGQLDMIESKADEAIRWFETALKVKPTEYVFDNTEFLIHNTLGNLSVLYAMVGRDADAKRVYGIAKKMKLNEEWLSSTVGTLFK
jgi:tetratricopeptide (TPR) repeat protein